VSFRIPKPHADGFTLDHPANELDPNPHTTLMFKQGLKLSIENESLKKQVALLEQEIIRLKQEISELKNRD
jgi:hypothetical protein